MEPVIDHVQITVPDLDVAAAFYDRLMPLLGFDPKRRTSAVLASHDLRVVEYSHPRLCFAISSPRAAFADEAVHRRKPGALHHLAFKASSRAEVDALHEALVAIGATIVSAPREYPEYAPAGYYAVYFKDPAGVKYEVVTY
jgi:catechol 2,3-dioxygenase-like lactoylglutathione lyase family enzyme